MKIIETLNQEMKNFLKEIEENKTKKFRKPTNVLGNAKKTKKIQTSE